MKYGSATKKRSWLIFLSLSPFPLRRLISTAVIRKVQAYSLICQRGSGHLSACGRPACRSSLWWGAAHSSTVQLTGSHFSRHWLNFQVTVKSGIPLIVFFHDSSIRGCLQSWSQELMQTEGVGFVFHLCQVQVFVPLHLRTLVLRCSAKCSEVRSGVTKGKRKLCERRMEDLFVLPSSLMSKKGKWTMFVFYYVYLNRFSTVTWADSAHKIHIAAWAVYAGSAWSYTLQI